MVFEQKLIDSADKSVLFGAVVADHAGAGGGTGETARQAADGCRASIPWPAYLTEDQTEKLQADRRDQTGDRADAFQPARPAAGEH